MKKTESMRTQSLAAAGTLEMLEQQAGEFLSPVCRAGLEEAARCIRESCKRRRPLLAVCGDFQVGKSTTVNLFAGGRNLSPCGKNAGLCTSRCRVEVEHTGRSSEYAEITWHTLSEMEALLGSLLPPEGDGDKSRPLPLGSPEALEDAWKLLEQRWSAYRRAEDGELEQEEALKDAVLLLVGAGDESLSALRKQRFFALEEAGSFLRASGMPDLWKYLSKAADGSLRDRAGLIDRYASLHLFIKAIRLHIHSPELEALDAVIVDVPGFNANDQDTRVAAGACRDADAILFLLDGERQLSEGGRRTLRGFQEMGFGEKLIYAVNFRKPPGRLRRSGLEEVLRLEIGSCGLPAPSKLLCYNAFLAGRAKQGWLLLGKKMDAETAEQIRWDAMVEFGGAAQGEYVSWLGTTVSALHRCRLPVLKALEEWGLEKHVLRRLLDESGWPLLYAALESALESRRASGGQKRDGLAQALKMLDGLEKEVAQTTEKRFRSLHETEASLKEASRKRNARTQERLDTLARDLPEISGEELCERYHREVLGLCMDESIRNVLMEAGKRMWLRFADQLFRAWALGSRTAEPVFTAEQWEHVPLLVVECLASHERRWNKQLQEENDAYAQALFQETVQSPQREGPAMPWCPPEAQAELAENVKRLMQSVASSPELLVPQQQERAREMLEKGMRRVFDALWETTRRHFQERGGEALCEWFRSDRERAFFAAQMNARRGWQQQDRKWIAALRKDRRELERFLRLWQMQCVPQITLLRRDLADLLIEVGEQSETKDPG